MDAIILSNLTAVQQADGVRLSCSVSSSDLPDHLWFFIRGIDLADINPTRYDWAVVGLLFPAMLRGKSIIVQGEVSERIFTNVNVDLQEILCIFNPKLKRIQLQADSLSNARAVKKSNRIATGFSAGIDSFTTLALFSEKNAKTALQITDLCTFNVGAMGKSGAAGVAELFERYRDRTNSYAISKGLGNISLDSNLSEFYSSFNFQSTHTLRNASAALCLQGVLDYYLYSSTYDLASIRVSENYDTAFLEPIILPMLSTESLTFMSSGASLSRFQKTALVAKFEPAYELLDVCVEPAKDRVGRQYPNCSRCWKCRRTLITLDVVGALDHFHRVFDLDHYRKNKAKMFEELIVAGMSGNALDMEVIRNSSGNQGHSLLISWKVFATKAKARWKKLFKG